MTETKTTPTVCRLCPAAYPDLADHFAAVGCEGEGGEHTPAAVVLATVLAACVHGANTTDEHAAWFLDDALHLLYVLGPAASWSVAQDDDDPERWTINGVRFALDYGATGEGPGTLTPIAPDQTCPACEESVGWRLLDDRPEHVTVECQGCGHELLVERWWPVAPAEVSR